MKSSSGVKCLAAAIAVAAVVLPRPGLAQAECPRFPVVAFWGEITHESVSLHVDAKLSGDWDTYIDQLQYQYTKLKDIHERGSAVAIKRSGKKIRLAGKKLAKYLKLSAIRLAVIRCLAEVAEMADLSNFSTAAGSPSDLPESDAPMATRRDEAYMRRTYIILPDHLLVRLRGIAVRRGLEEKRQTSVSEIIVELLEQGLRRRNN